MKKICTIILLIFLSNCLTYSQISFKPGIFIGLGTSISSYIGSDFGSTFAIRFIDFGSNNNDYYINHNNYNNNNSSLISPLQFDISAGININPKFSALVESSFIWHFNGRPDPKFESGIINKGWYYLDRWDNSTLFAVPVFLSLRYYPMGKHLSSFFISAGYGLQYTKESIERVREEYTYNYSYYSSSFSYPTAYYSESRWLKGIKLSAGVSYLISPNMTGEMELKISNFSAEKNINSPLKMFTSPNITNLSLSTKIYFSF